MSTDAATDTARITFLAVHLAPAATPQAHIQPASEVSDRFIRVQFTSEVVVAMSIEQAVTLRSELDRVLLAARLAVEVQA